MKKDEYFQNIADLASERRKKSEYSKEEMGIYLEGKKDAYKEILRSTYPNKKIQDIWDEEKFSVQELQKYVEINIKDLQERLKKARKVYVSQTKLLRNLTQMSIE